MTRGATLLIFVLWHRLRRFSRGACGVVSLVSVTGHDDFRPAIRRRGFRFHITPGRGFVFWLCDCALECTKRRSRACTPGYLFGHHGLDRGDCLLGGLRGNTRVCAWPDLGRCRPGNGAGTGIWPGACAQWIKQRIRPDLSPSDQVQICVPPSVSPCLFLSAPTDE